MAASASELPATVKRPPKSDFKRDGSTKKKRRGDKGRANIATAENTRDRILRVAIAEFAEKGYSGARVDVICKLSRANPRMIYHYFGGKDHLYIAVLEQVLGELRTEELKLDVAHVAPIDGMMQLFDFTYDHFGGHPELIYLLSGENLQKARFLRRSVKTPIIASPLIRLIDELLRRGEKEGDFRRGIDPLQLYVTMVGFAYFHRSNAYTLSVIFQSDLLAPPWQAAHKRYAKEMLLRFLRRDRA
ncbi:MAG: TetR/AcrR family transcriptional regulator [Xanthobacteraceae bacterium]